jgi:hypothetical protein
MRVPAREAKTFSAVWLSLIDLPVRLGHSGHLPLADQPDVRAGVVLSSVPVLSVLTPPTDGGGEGRLLVSVAVTLEEAPLLARAAQATIDLVLLPRAGDG